MANRKDDRERVDSPLHDEDFYFEDDFDMVTRDLPSAPVAPPEEEEDVPAPLTEGVGLAGVRMVGKPGVLLHPEDADAYDGGAGLDDLALEDEDAYDGRTDDEARTTFRKPMRKPSPTPLTRSAARAEAERRDAERREAERREADAAPKKKKKQKRVAVEEDRRSRHPVLRVVILTIITSLLLGVMGLMILSRTMYPDLSLLKLPEQAVSASMNPLQSLFTGVTESIAGYFRDLKLMQNIVDAYNDVVAQNEELAREAARANEYARQLAMYKDIDAEIQENLEANPVVCQVIGREQGNFFSTFTINKGSRHGLEEYMAVTIGGALVGFTEEVYETTATVRTIIDSNASIAGLIQSSRDQGIVSGTLGIDGEALCRMYYLDSAHLPRPGDIVVTSGVGMSFPKGIPIGTVRESTRSLDANKQYIVIEPMVDFQHLEFVIVYCFKPAAEAVEGRESVYTYNQYVPTVTARPYPTLKIGSTLNFGETPTPLPTVSVTPSPTPTVTPTPSPTPRPTVVTTGSSFNYSSTLLGPTATPTPSPTPSPTPVITVDPNQMTWEEE